MQINIIYDSSVNSAPAAFKTAVSYVVNLLDAAFTNNVTLNIHVGWGEIGGAALNANDLGESEEAEAPRYDYTTIRDALIAHGTSADQLAAFATLPASDPTGGGVFDIGRAEAKALGLINADDTTIDGWVGFSTSANTDWSFNPTATPGPNQYYLVGSIEHEITEVMGRDSELGVKGEHYSNGWGVPDLFRFSAPGVRELASGAVHSTGYFSIDDGATSLGSWNNHIAKGDLGDWDSGYGSGGGPGPFGNDSFNNESDYGVINGLTQNDLTLMQVLGWDPSLPDNFVINGEIYYVASGQTAANLVVQPGGTLDVSGIADSAILHGGNAEVYNGGVIHGITVEAGATLNVDAGGSADGVFIAGGLADFNNNASTGTTPIVFEGSGGTLEIDGHAAPTNVISGFAIGDTIDFYGANIGSNATVALLPGNVLELAEHNKTYDFQLDPNDNFAGQTFGVGGDGYGGTAIYLLPSVLSVTTSGTGITDGNGDLDAGHSVTFTLNMSDAVTVDTTHGTPTLLLNDGGVATYAGGSGSDALTFSYAVAAGDNTADLAVSGFQLHGASLTDTYGHQASMIGAATNPNGILQIDTTAPETSGVTAAPMTGTETAGASIGLTLAFNEAVTVSGGTPSLTLNNGANAIYDTAATMALHDPTKLAFDYLVSGSDNPTSSLALTGVSLNGAAIADLAGNAADLSHVNASFAGLSVNDAPAFSDSGLTRPELHFGTADNIVLDSSTSSFASAYGLEYLYLGLPAGTPYPPVPDTSSGFHLV
ncbi:NF038122 family metalloprotease [Bradyrhizobium tropiciagri]|uniref:NF038122 family metalloprotease n=1 Tax=Bradyrhizobium tropiciagri TaxID=312253 RepID=UPI001BAD0406|nr:NF038122 family metalloprotease [Bradyrhizobium tropiciagri]MBR0894841.1 NF038122 family metalloprotease [Bradyrhizobium tropiciagri]